MNYFKISVYSTLIISIIFLPGCYGNFKITLPNNYSLVSQYSGSVCIADYNGDVLVGPEPTVDGYKVYGAIIVGHVSDVNGFFIINTSNKFMKDSLSKSAWLDLLRQNKIYEEPNLHKPTRFDKSY